MEEFQTIQDFLDIFVAEELWGDLLDDSPNEFQDISSSSRRAKRRRRITPKQEIDRVQDEIRQLSTQLQALTTTRSQRVHSSSSELWHRIAVHQLERRRDSESENAKLREMVKLQIEEAKSLKRILKRRTKIQRLHEMVEGDQQQQEQTAATFDQEKGMSSIPCPGRKRLTDSKMLNGVCFELTQREMVPFSSDMVKDAVWSSLGQLELEGLRSAGDFKADVQFRTQNSEGDTNTVMVGFVAVHSSGRTTGVKARKVVRRYDEDSRTVFIYRTFMEPKLYNLTESVGVHATTTLLIDVRDGEPSGEATLIQSHFSATRHDEGLAAGHRLRLDVNLNVAIAVWDESISRIHDQVENCLMDEAFNRYHRMVGGRPPSD